MKLTILPGDRRIKAALHSNFTLQSRRHIVRFGDAGLLDSYDRKDATYGTFSTGSTRIDTEITLLGDPGIYSYESNNPEIASVDDFGYVTSTGNGMATVYVENRGVKRGVHHQSVVANPIETEIMISYLPETLGRAIFDKIDALKGVSNDTRLMVGGGWNAGCYAASLDWSGVAAVNSHRGSVGGATPISRRHVLMASHASISKGATFTYISPSGDPVQRQVSDFISISPHLQSDIDIGVLNEDLPPEIASYSVLPPSPKAWLTPGGLPILLSVNRVRNAMVRTWDADTATLSRAVEHGLAASHSAPVIPGDSGQPVFCPLAGELILLGSHCYTGSFQAIASFIPEINAAMTTLGGGYQLQIVDLSGFPNYGGTP